MPLETYLPLLSEHEPYEDDPHTYRVGAAGKKRCLRCADYADYWRNRGDIGEYFSQVVGINTEYVKKVVEKSDKCAIINVSAYMDFYHK